MILINQLTKDMEKIKIKQRERVKTFTLFQVYQKLLKIFV